MLGILWSLCDELPSWRMLEANCCVAVCSGSQENAHSMAAGLRVNALIDNGIQAGHS